VVMHVPVERTGPELTGEPPAVEARDARAS
jgi:hypothetical protein